MSTLTFTMLSTSSDLQGAVKDKISAPIRHVNKTRMSALLWSLEKSPKHTGKHTIIPQKQDKNNPDTSQHYTSAVPAKVTISPSPQCGLEFTFTLMMHLLMC